VKYRKLSTDAVVAGEFVPGGDMVFGHGKSDFWQNVPEAPAQAVVTRLRLQTGEWFLDLTEGTPWKTRVLGKYTENSRDLVIRYRTSGTRGVTEINNYSSNLDREIRAFTVDMTISTIYGAARIQEPI
jgi:hypothetical protein